MVASKRLFENIRTTWIVGSCLGDGTLETRKSADLRDIKMAKLQNEPKPADLQLTAVLYALSDEIRLRIVQRLDQADEIACGYFDIDMPKSSLSHHFRVLRTAGVVTTRKNGTALMNRLRRADLDARFPGLLDSVLASVGNKTKAKSNLRRRSAAAGNAAN